jgi:hypothetical protein
LGTERFFGVLRLNALQPVFLQRLQGVASRHHTDLMTRLGQVQANPTANGTGTVNANFHKR